MLPLWNRHLQKLFFVVNGLLDSRTDECKFGVGAFGNGFACRAHCLKSLRAVSGAPTGRAGPWIWSDGRSRYSDLKEALTAAGAMGFRWGWGDADGLRVRLRELSRSILP